MQLPQHRGERWGGDISQTAPSGRAGTELSARPAVAGLLRAEKRRGEGVTDLKLTCQTPHQYYDKSPHRFSDPACCLTAAPWLRGGRAGCRAGSAGGQRASVPPHGTLATSVLLSTTTNPSFPSPKTVKKKQPHSTGGDGRNSILQGQRERCFQFAGTCLAQHPCIPQNCPLWFWRGETTWCLAGLFLQ